MFKRSPGFYLLLGVLWSTAFLLRVLESGFTVACIPAGLGAVISYTTAVFLAIKRKGIGYHFFEFDGVPIFYLASGILCSCVFLQGVLEGGINVAYIPVGLGAVISYAIAILLSIKYKREENHYEKNS